MARLYKVDDYLKHLFFLNFFAFPYSPKGKIPIFASVLHTKTTGQQPVHIELTLLFSKSEIRQISNAQRISIAGSSRCRRELYPILFCARFLAEPPIEISLKRTIPPH